MPARDFDPDFGSATGAAQAILGKQISARELVAHTFQRISKLNPRLNGIVLQFQEESLMRAGQADAALARGELWGPLHGVPITVKESFAMQGIATTAGAFRELRPSRNAAAVDRLLNAGAIVTGKTNVPVMLSDWQSYNPIYGQSNNPWDVTRTPGGSTGGGSAALAAGMGFLALGSDIGGSIRIPSHFCGLYGHKPTFGLVSLQGHVPPALDLPYRLFDDLPVAGPLARSAGDLRVALNVLGGPSGGEAKAWKWTLPAPRQTALRDFRVGYVFDDPYCPASSEVQPAFENTLRALEKAGVKLDHGWPAGVDPQAQMANYLYLLACVINPPVNADEEARLREQYKQNPRDPFLAARFEPHYRWVVETARRLAARAAWQQYFETHDVFLTPVGFVPAFPHDHSDPLTRRMLQTPEGPRPYMDLMKWVCLPTLAGLPATVAPIGKTAGGLPVGVQIVGPHSEDGTPIEFAERLAEVIGGFEAPRLD